MNENLRKQIFNTLNQKETSELAEIWQKNDHTEWTEEAFLSVQEILRNRIGELPPQNPPIYKSVDEVEENEASDYDDPRIKSLSETKNIDGLVDVLKNEPEPRLRLEAAESLAKLGDERGLDYLIEAMEFDDINISADAEEILSELNLPKGILALHSHMLNHNRTIYRRRDEHLEEKDYLIAYGSILVFGFLASLILGILPLPRLFIFLGNLVAGYYVFKYVVKSRIIAA